MFRIIKYLKKSVVPILFIIILLIGQALCDLSLPDYTSNIVNIGIQQGGVEDSLPNVIRKSELDTILIFANKDKREEILGNYTLLSKSSLDDSDFEKYKSEYPLLEEENLYKLNDDISKEKRAELSSLISRPIFIKSNMESHEDSKHMIYVFSIMPEDEVEAVVDSMNEKFNNMPDSMIDQSAISFVRTEYKEIGVDIDKMQTKYILTTGGKMIGLAFVSMALAVAVGFIASMIAAKVSKNLRISVFNKVMKFSNEEMEKFSTASLITRSTNDIQQVQTVIVMALRIMLYAPILGLGGVYKVFQTNTSMSWIIGLAVAIIFCVITVLFSLVMPKFKNLQKLVDKLNLVTREIITGVPVIRAFSTQKHESERFDKANKELTKTNIFVNRAMSGMMPIMMLVMNGITILIVWSGAKSIDSGSMQVGDMMAFIQYAMQIIMSFLMISMMSIMLPRASVSATRIDEVLETEIKLKDPETKVSFDENKKGVVEFKNVSFTYPDADEAVLKNISFTAKKGETTAFIGGTGSGKSTLINLVPRFYDVTEGEILVDGVNIKNVSQHDLRDKIGYVPQKGVLFSGTIDSNLRYGNENASAEEISKAARIAQATEFIEAKEEKFESSIAQGGTNVSGGQKQRLSIARAIATNPEIFIFDDSFSALDYKTDSILRKALKDELSDSTILLVAQRISTILHAEQIIVLDEGEIVGKGTHKELLKNCEVYRQIAQSQLSKEELENE